MIYGNNGDKFTLVPNDDGLVQLVRNGLATYCPYMGANWDAGNGMQCASHCSQFHIHKEESEITTVHLRCTETVIRIK